MKFNNMLSIAYVNTLKFKHLDGFTFTQDVSLPMPPEDAINLLQKIRESLLEGNVQCSIKVSSYDIDIAAYGNTAFSLNIMETKGQMSKPVGLYKYDSYAGGIPVLRGSF